jgi:hypothetical protein
LASSDGLAIERGLNPSKDRTARGTLHNLREDAEYEYSW